MGSEALDLHAAAVERLSAAFTHPRLDYDEYRVAMETIRSAGLCSWEVLEALIARDDYAIMYPRATLDPNLYQLIDMIGHDLGLTLIQTHILIVHITADLFLFACPMALNPLTDAAQALYDLTRRGETPDSPDWLDRLEDIDDDPDGVSHLSVIGHVMVKNQTAVLIGPFEQYCNLDTLVHQYDRRVYGAFKRETPSTRTKAAQTLYRRAITTLRAHPIM